MRFLIRLGSAGSPRDRLLTTVRALARSVGVEARNPKWTSYGALEVDVFAPARPDFDLFISTLGPIAEVEFARDLNVASPHRTEQETFSEARAYFNSERYWECHEALEGLWRLKQGEEKQLLQGLILVCAAFVHHQKGEDEVALGVLERASAKLASQSVTYGGFELPPLRRRVQEILLTRRFSDFHI